MASKRQPGALEQMTNSVALTLVARLAMVLTVPILIWLFQTVIETSKQLSNLHTLTIQEGIAIRERLARNERSLERVEDRINKQLEQERRSVPD